MKKWIYIGIGAVVVVAAVIIFGLSNLGPLIKTAVNSYGPKITDTKLHVDNVSVALFSGEAKVENLFLGNPAGFKEPSAIKVGSVMVKVNEKSLTGNTIIVDRIVVIRPQITLEQKGERDNFHTILNNIAKNSGSENQKTQESETQRSKKKIIIRDFIIRNGEVNLALSAYNLGDRTISSPLPDIHLKNIGENKSGVSPAEAFREVFAVLYGKILSPAVTDVLNKQLKSMGANVNLLGNEAVKQLGTTGKNVEKTIMDIGNNAKGILGK